MAGSGAPLILVAASDDAMRRRLVADVAHRFDADYAVVGAASGGAALDRLRERPDNVAAVVAYRQLSDMAGVDLLASAAAVAPGAKRGLLLAFGELDANQALMQAAAFGRVDRWEWWDPVEPREERLYPLVEALLTAWSRGRDLERFAAITIVGPRWSARTHQLRDILHRNGLPFRFEEAEGETAVVLEGRRRLVQPTSAELAAALGVRTRPAESRCDLAVVGAGPAGLAAAVYGSSEGLHTVLLEAEAIGGQAGTSAMIRNYLGFPGGVSGEELARLASEQATQLGAEFVYARVVGLRPDADRHELLLADGTALHARSLVLATGVSYRRLTARGIERLTGAGVFYGAATTEAEALRGQDVYVAGAANSAGQAALHLARFARTVTLLVRGPSLAAKMSDYLVRDIERTPNVVVRTRTEVVAAGGRERLERLTLHRSDDNAQEEVTAAGLFVLIGGSPRTDWLQDAVAVDEDGYVLTGGALLHETSVPGIFAAGDVRHGSIKRVASAVGEGAVTVRMVHERLAARAASVG